MASDSEQLLALTRWLTRTQDVYSIQAIADAAAADLLSGKLVTSVSFEGGGGTMKISCDPAVIINACEDVLLAMGESDVVPARSVSIFTRFYGETLQT